MDFLSLLWLFIILSSLTPVLQRWLVERSRMAIMNQLQRRRGSRVIALIHRQESMSFLGIPFMRYIDIEDSEAILRAIRMTPEDMPIDLIVHTPGGLVLAAEQIAEALIRHKGKVTVFVPHYAMSGGTLIALAADEIAMDPNAVLGPVDPQLGEYPAASILAAVRQKPVDKLEDRTLILADVAQKAVEQVKRTVKTLLVANGMEEGKATEIADILSLGRWTHDYPISAQEAIELGLPVTLGLPNEVYALMDLYPQPGLRRPSVQYIPVPYRREEHPPRQPLK
jgi:ClpP class serine protease